MTIDRIMDELGTGCQDRKVVQLCEKLGVPIPPISFASRLEYAIIEAMVSCNVYTDDEILWNAGKYREGHAAIKLDKGSA